MKTLLTIFAVAGFVFLGAFSIFADSPADSFPDNNTSFTPNCHAVTDEDFTHPHENLDDEDYPHHHTEEGFMHHRDELEDEHHHEDLEDDEKHQHHHQASTD